MFCCKKKQNKTIGERWCWAQNKWWLEYRCNSENHLWAHVLTLTLAYHRGFATHRRHTARHSPNSQTKINTLCETRRATGSETFISGLQQNVFWAISPIASVGQWCNNEPWWVAKIFVSVRILGVDHVDNEVLGFAIISQLAQPLKVERVGNSNLNQGRNHVSRCNTLYYVVRICCSELIDENFIMNHFFLKGKIQQCSS